MHTPEFWPVGDAIADPLTGVTAAAAAIELLAGGTSALVDVSMHDVTREAVTHEPIPHTVEEFQGAWLVVSDTGEHPVAAPHLRVAEGRAPVMGQHQALLHRT